MTPDEWDALSVEARYEILARCQAGDTMKAWESLTAKERTRAVWEWREGQRRKRHDGAKEP